MIRNNFALSLGSLSQGSRPRPSGRAVNENRPRGPLTSVWIPTGNPRQPLARIWVDRREAAADTAAASASRPHRGLFLVHA